MHKRSGSTGRKLGRQAAPQLARASEARRRSKRSAPTEWTRQNTRINTWFERDRASVVLETLDGTSIIEWWDDDVHEAVRDGFLNPRDWHGSAIEYANQMGAQPATSEARGRGRATEYPNARRSAHRRPQRASEGVPNAISMYQEAQIFINGRYQVGFTITPSRGIESAVRVVLGITRAGDLIEVKQDGNVWAFTRTERGFKNNDTGKEYPIDPESHWTDRQPRRRPTRRR